MDYGNNKFIGGYGAYKQLSKGGFNASAYGKSWKKQQESQIPDFGGGTNSDKANTVSQGKSLWENIGDFLGGVGSNVAKTVSEGAQGAKDFAESTVKGLGNAIDIGINQSKDKQYLAGIKAINDKYDKQANQQVFGNNPNVSDVSKLPQDKQDAWKKIQSDRKAELRVYENNNSNQKSDSNQMAQAFNEQKQNEQKFNESGQKLYNAAQWIPGVSAGVEGLGTIGAAIQGNNGDINKGLIKLTQGQDWDKLTDAQKQQALANRNVGAALSTLDFIPAAKALGTGVKTAVKEGVGAGAKAAAESIGKEVAGKTIGEVASMGVKPLVKQAAKSTAIGAGVGAALGAGTNAVMGGNDMVGAIQQGAAGGAIGGLLGSPLDINASKAVKEGIPTNTAKTIETPTTGAGANESKQLQAVTNTNAAQQIKDMQNGKFSNDMYDIVKSDGTPASQKDITDATNKQLDILQKQRDTIAPQIDSITDPAAKEKAVSAVNNIDSKISQLKSGDTSALMDIKDSGISKVLNTDKVRSKFSQLQEAANTQIPKENMPSKTLDTTDSEMNAVSAGGVAPEAVTPKPDFKNIDDVLGESKLPTPIRARAASLKNNLVELDRQRSLLMTPEKKESLLDVADKDFQDKAAVINNMPEPRRTDELNKLQDNYNNLYNDINDKYNQDKPVTDALSNTEERIKSNIFETVNDANTIKNNNPTEFGNVDETKNKQIQDEIEADHQTAIFNNMSDNQGTPDAENVNKAWIGSTPEKIDQALETPQIGNLTKASINDTFTNESVKGLTNAIRPTALSRTYLGQSLSSANVNLEKLFGKKGKEIFGNIVKAYGKTNTANMAIAKTLTQVQKSFGKNKELFKNVVDVLEGKKVDMTMFSSAQRNSIQTLKDQFDYAARQVKILAYNDTVHNFEKRQANGNIKFTGDEINVLAKRDGISASEAKSKYGNIDNFTNKDIADIATYNANHSTIDNYFPHLFDGKGREKNNYSNDEYVKSTGDIQFGNMMHRLSSDTNYSKDVIDVCSRYFSALNKKAYLEPALQQLDNAKLAIKAADNGGEDAWKWIDKYQGQLKYNKSSDVASAYNKMVDNVLSKNSPDNKHIGENHFRNILSTQRQINSLASLGLSFRNALQQVTQLGSAVGGLGGKNVTIGMIKYIKQALDPTMSKEYNKMLEERGVINAGIAKEAYSDLSDTKMMGTLKTVGEKISNGLMKMTQVVDEFARGSTYEASLHENLKKGMSFEDADNIATSDAAKYNFLTSKVDMPIKLNGDVIRTLAQFSTFSYKQAEMWKELGINAIKNPETGKYQLRPREMGRLVQMIVFYGAAFSALQQVAGIEPQDNIPFYGNIFGGEGLPRSPLVSILFGENNKPGLLGIVGGLVAPTGNSDYEREDNRNQMFSELGDLMFKNFVPAGNQLSKSNEGYMSTENGGVVTKDGKTRFIQNTDDASKLKATLFGQYSTNAGQQWIDKKFPTTSETQTKIIKAQNTQSAKQRAYDFFTSMKGVGAKSNVVSDIEENMKTQPNKASRMIQEHNDNVNQALKDYQKKYGQLNDYEKKYLISKFYITEKTIENMNKKVSKEN